MRDFPEPESFEDTAASVRNNTAALLREIIERKRAERLANNTSAEPFRYNFSDETKKGFWNKVKVRKAEKQTERDHKVIDDFHTLRDKYLHKKKWGFRHFLTRLMPDGDRRDSMLKKVLGGNNEADSQMRLMAYKSAKGELKMRQAIAGLPIEDAEGQLHQELSRPPRSTGERLHDDAQALRKDAQDRTSIQNIFATYGQTLDPNGENVFQSPEPKQVKVAPAQKSDAYLGEVIRPHDDKTLIDRWAACAKVTEPVKPEKPSYRMGQIIPVTNKKGETEFYKVTGFGKNGKAKVRPFGYRPDALAA